MKAKKRLGERLVEAMEQALAHARGEVGLRTWAVATPDPAPKRSGKQIASLRKALDMPQFALAEVLNVSVKTVQAWEQGVRKPDGAALRLLQILTEFPQVMEQVPGMRYYRKLINPGPIAESHSRRRKRVA